MVKKHGEKLSKRVTNKVCFRKFVESDYTDFVSFYKSCKGVEDLLIYTCISKERFKEQYVENLKKLDTIEQQIKYLKLKQPFMNESEELFDICVKDSIPDYLKKYISFNGFLMNNGTGDAEDWEQEFWLKYLKICDFYRIRWFHPDTLKKESTVKYNLVNYKEFVYICRMSITGERRHQAFLATQKPDSSIFKPSLDFKTDQSTRTTRASMLNTITDRSNNSDTLNDILHIDHIKKEALLLSDNYENGRYTKEIERFYQKEDTVGVNKKVVILGKIFLYKAGLRSQKTLSFIKALSATYKSKFNISSALINKQLAEYKNKKVVRVPTYEDVLEDGGKKRLGLILKKRGNV